MLFGILMFFFFFFFNDTATTEIYTLSLHDALPIYHNSDRDGGNAVHGDQLRDAGARVSERGVRDRKSTRLNSSHLVISYAVFCLKKKKNHFDLASYRRGDSYTVQFAEPALARLEST